jgi:hypothetical protein
LDAFEYGILKIHGFTIYPEKASRNQMKRFWLSS